MTPQEYVNSLVTILNPANEIDPTPFFTIDGELKLTEIEYMLIDQAMRPQVGKLAMLGKLPHTDWKRLVEDSMSGNGDFNTHCFRISFLDALSKMRKLDDKPHEIAPNILSLSKETLALVHFESVVKECAEYIAQLPAEQQSTSAWTYMWIVAFDAFATEATLNAMRIKKIIESDVLADNVLLKSLLMSYNLLSTTHPRTLNSKLGVRVVSYIRPGEEDEQREKNRPTNTVVNNFHYHPVEHYDADGKLLPEFRH